MEAIRRRAAGVLAYAYGIGSLLWMLLQPTVSDLGFALQFVLEVLQVGYFLVSGVALCFGVSDRCRRTHEAAAALLVAAMLAELVIRGGPSEFYPRQLWSLAVLLAMLRCLPGPPAPEVGVAIEACSSGGVTAQPVARAAEV